MFIVYHFEALHTFHSILLLQLEKQANEIGVWSYYFKFSPVAVRSGFRVSLEVLGTVTDDRAVSLDFWTDVTDKAVVLYASLASHRGQLPVRNAKVSQYI